MQSYQPPPHLSDHKPLSISISETSRKNNRHRFIPRWVTEASDFTEELNHEYQSRLEDFRRYNSQTPTSFDKLQLLKDSAHATSGYIQRRCKDKMASTTEHKLAMCMSFMKAIRCAEYKRVRSLQSKCRELEGIRINEDTQFSEDFNSQGQGDRAHAD